MASYETLKHELDSQLLRASSLTGQEAQTFVAQTFKGFYEKLKSKEITHDVYVKLMNRLAVYQRGKFNDYIDMLAGSAQLGMLDVAMQGGGIFSPDAAHQRRDAITGITGVDPIEPEE